MKYLVLFFMLTTAICAAPVLDEIENLISEAIEPYVKGIVNNGEFTHENTFIRDVSIEGDSIIVQGVYHFSDIVIDSTRIKKSEKAIAEREAEYQRLRDNQPYHDPNITPGGYYASPGGGFTLLPATVPARTYRSKTETKSYNLNFIAIIKKIFDSYVVVTIYKYYLHERNIIFPVKN